jgi:hypothetical protein
MESLPKLILLAVGLAFMLAAASAPVDAASKIRKHKRHTAQSATTASATHRGTHLFPPGPLFAAGVYLGDDPDPNIRFQLWRDLGGRLGGDSN